MLHIQKAHWLVASGAATKVVFHCKTEPWFVSDTMLHDFEWQVQQLESAADAALSTVGKLFRDHMLAGEKKINVLIQNMLENT